MLQHKLLGCLLPALLLLDAAAGRATAHSGYVSGVAGHELGKAVSASGRRLLEMDTNEYIQLLSSNKTRTVTVEGTLAVAISHSPAGKIYMPNVVVNGSISIPVRLTEVAETEEPPVSVSPGQQVMVRGKMHRDGLHVKNWDSFEQLSVSIMGDLTQRVTRMKALWIVFSSSPACGDQQTEAQTRDMMQRVAATWSSCSHGSFTFDVAASRILYGVPADCSSCDSTAIEAQRQRGLQIARQRGINPDDYPYLLFLWPRVINDRCFPGQAFIGCSGHSGYLCRADVSHPWNNDLGTVLHEVGHNIGLDHATARAGACAQSEYSGQSSGYSCGEGEYGDQTSPMGLNAAGHCFNLPQQHYLGWSSPQLTLGNARLPVGKVVSTRIRPLTAGRQAGLRVRVDNKPAVYFDFLIKTGARSNLLSWWDRRVSIYAYDWDGVTFRPGYWTSKKTQFLGALSSDGDRQVIGGGDLPNIVVRRSGTRSDGTTVVQVCRYSSSPSQCSI